MPSVVDICNRALSRVGDTRITSLTDGTKQATACNSAYEHIRDEVLRSHPWNSAIARASIAKLSDAPAFGYDDQYQLPADCLRVVEVYDSRLPWVVEGDVILSDDGSPLKIRYIKQETDPNKYDPLLLSAIAGRLALELVEELTQSNTKRERALQEFEVIMSTARRADAQEQSSMPFEEDDWILARVSGTGIPRVKADPVDYE
jgi:hypothetical protein